MAAAMASNPMDRLRSLPVRSSSTPIMPPMSAAVATSGQLVCSRVAMLAAASAQA